MVAVILPPGTSAAYTSADPTTCAYPPPPPGTGACGAGGKKENREVSSDTYCYYYRDRNSYVCMRTPVRCTYGRSTWRYGTVYLRRFFLQVVRTSHDRITFHIFRLIRHRTDFAVFVIGVCRRTIIIIVIVEETIAVSGRL